MNDNNKMPKTDKYGNRLHYKTGLYVSKTGNFFIGGGGNYSHIYRNAGQKPYIKAKGSTYNVEDLVTDCYLPKPQGNYVIRHKDGDLDNCNVNNLEWVPDAYTFNTNDSTKMRINGVEIIVKSNGEVYEGNNKLNQYDTLDDRDTDLWVCIRPFVHVDGKRIFMDDIVDKAHYVHGDKYSLNAPVILHKDYNRDNFSSDNLKWVERADQEYINYREAEVVHIKNRNKELNPGIDLSNSMAIL